MAGVEEDAVVEGLGMVVVVDTGSEADGNCWYYIIFVLLVFWWYWYQHSAGVKLVILFMIRKYISVGMSVNKIYKYLGIQGSCDYEAIRLSVFIMNEELQ